MKKIKYVALLRGINAGGNNIIKMNELKILFEKLNLSDVQTYIQCGNVIFNDSEKDKLELIEKIENKLYEILDNEIKVSLLTLSEMEEIITMKPHKYGEENEKYKYDVIFLIEPLTAKEAMKEVQARDGVDEVYEGNKVLYFKRLKEKITKTYLTKIIGTPIYKNMTLRNWNTTGKVFELMERNNKK
ncbi:MAG: DUF1697 domain-containing protein [Synergistaceae bacterium]|nr:DUF1697 domain-containing protein [Synergistaceae bacterium]